MKDSIEDSHVHDGHRGRMRAKFLSYGQKIFDTYELLEMLLYYVVPYRDTNPIAKNLLYKFDGLDGVLSAKADDLISVKGIGDGACALIKKTARLSAVIGAEISCDVGPELSNYSAVGAYLVNYFQEIKEPRVVAMFFDNSMKLLDFRTLYELDYSSGGVKPSPFLDAAIRLRASVVITAHHHPHGPFYPSQGDRATNKAITEALSLAGIIHAEHYLVCGESFSGINAMWNFGAKLSQSPEIDGFFESKAAMGGESDGIMSLRDRNESGFLSASSLVCYLSSLLKSVSAADSDTVAQLLLNRYGTVEGIMTASVGELSALAGERAALFIKLLACITSRRVLDKYKAGKSYSATEISEYLRAAFIGQSVEAVYMLNFDKHGRFISAKILSEGTVNTTDILPRRALEIAISESAKSVILAHNHPFGKPEPSSDDINFTGVMRSVFSACDIELLGHYIVAGQRVNLISCGF